MYVIAHMVCMDTVGESALGADWEKISLLHQGFKPTSVLHLAFQLDAPSAGLFPPL